MSHVRVALVGYGVAGEHFHAPLIHATSGMQLAAIVTSDTERARRATGRYPGVVVHPRSEDVFQDPADYDLVVIATPNASHVPLATAALDASLPVVIDKPLATSAPEAQRLVDHAKQTGLLLTVFQNRRWDSDFLTLQP